MFDTYLVPEKTIACAKGDGPLVNINAAANRILLLQLNLTGITEQESLEISVFGGPDEQGIGKSPLVSFPQVFYVGQYPLLLNLTERPDIAILRVHWEVNRWGRGPETPWFEFNLKATEVSPELLRARDQRQQVAGDK